MDNKKLGSVKMDNKQLVDAKGFKDYDNKNKKASNSPTATVASEFIAHEKAQIKEKENKQLSVISTIILFVLSLCLVGAFGFVAYKTNNLLKEIKEGTKPDKKFYGIFAGFATTAIFASSVFAFSLIEVILISMSKYGVESGKGRFIMKVLHDERFYITICVATLTFPMILNFLTPFKELVDAYTNEKAEKYSFPTEYSYLFTLFIKNYSSIAHKIFFVCLLFLLKNMMLLVLNYNVKSKVFFKKQALNNIKVQVLRSLNKLVEATLDDTIEQVVQKVIIKVGRDDQNIYYTEVEEALGEETAEKFFAFADPSGDLKVSKEELISFYKKTFLERESIEKALEQSNVSIGSLDNGLSFLVFMISIFVIFSGTETDIKTKAITFGTTLITGSYIFSDLIKKFITALAFVFFIRSFEVGDIVYFSGDYYTVYSINLLATVFEKESLMTTVPNDKLYDATLSNLSASSAMDIYYSFKFDIAEFKEKSKDFLHDVVKYYRSHKSTFEYKPYFNNVKLLNNDVMTVDLVVGYNLKYHELAVIDKRKNSFMLYVHDCMAKVGLLAK
ncbi:hypothetical protein EHP00_454 [Ecytonucleospora hepatopenaei]|uniref:EF-hand domain-containing protein n=1 Tax=Ecytonucleospora hepatopenaei TaxID=646526 RepID=A0A1W0E8Y2_9MICR|nr:hypothetical protein EHP00_454 [Ecytonucleospora hepatopenaei]